MTPERSQQLVVGCLAASAAVAAGSALADSKPPGLRMLVGVSITGMTLAVVSQFSPDTAGMFAVLVLTTTVFVYGEPFLNAVISLTESGTIDSPAAGRNRK